MDPIYYQVNQTRLTENTQKSSDNLRIQQNKESKKKAERPGDVDKAAVTADSSSMSEDMLGDMDPDDYGGRGAKQFAQMWKEQLKEEREKEKEKDQQDAESEEEAEEPPQEPTDEQAPAKEETEIAPLAEAVEGVAIEPPPPTQATVAADPQKAAPPASGPDKPTAAEAPKSQNKATPASTRVIDVPDRIETKPAKTASAESAQVSAPQTAPSEASAQQRRASSLGSLLDFSSGFLIAEEAHWDPNAAEEQPETEVAAEEPIDEDIGAILERLVNGDSSQAGFRKLLGLLSRFGRRVLQQCQEAQAKVYLLPPGAPLSAHPQLAHVADEGLEGAAYLPQERLCLIEDRCVSEAPQGFHPVFFYFAHAFDHALGGETFASLKSPAVQASYQACLDGAHRFGDLMAAQSPAHYFAQAMESYLTENDCFEPLWTRQDLYDFDRSMYNYIEYLLQRKS